MSLHRQIVVGLYHLMTPGNLFLAFAFLLGIGFVPFLIYFRLLPGNRLKSMVSKVMWTICALSLGGDAYVADQRENGQYELNPVVSDADGYYIIRDGRKVALDEDADPDAWSRLGWRKFAITFEKGDQRMAAVSPEFEVDDVAADGGFVFTGVVRGGYPEIAEEVNDGFAVSMSRVDTLLEGAGGVEQAFVAGEQALKKHGGDDAGMSNLALILATLMAVISGAVLAWVMFGL